MNKALIIALLCVALVAVCAIWAIGHEQFEEQGIVLSTGGNEIVRKFYDASCEYIARDGEMVASDGLLKGANLYDGSKDAETVYASGSSDMNQQTCYFPLDDDVECSSTNRDLYRPEHESLVKGIKPAYLGPYFGNVCAVTLQKGQSPKQFTEYIEFLKEAPIKSIREQQSKVAGDAQLTDASVAQLEASVKATREAIKDLKARIKAQQDSNMALSVALQKANDAKTAAEKGVQEASAKLKAACVDSISPLSATLAAACKTSIPAP